MGKIKIGKVKPNLISYSQWDNEEMPSYLDFNIHDYLLEADTNVVKVFFSKSSFCAITAFVNESLDVGGEAPIPEIGGFLFGQVKQLSTDHYEVKVETFEAVSQPEKSNSSKLEMGLSAGMALEKNNKAKNGLMLVGWFHTHPGHTPFLSKTDLNKTHNLFFTLPFHIAIVLDCLTPEFDTGIFTRKRDCSMNNAHDFKKWISWKTEITT